MIKIFTTFILLLLFIIIKYEKIKHSKTNNFSLFKRTFTF